MGKMVDRSGTAIGRVAASSTPAYGQHPFPAYGQHPFPASRRVRLKENAMLNRIKSLAAGFGASSGSSSSAASIDTNEETKQLAAAALMVEAATMDGNFDESEADAISRIIRHHFGLNEEEAASLLDAAREAQEAANHLMRFTKAVKESFPFEERVKIIEMLWEVVYADGEVHHYEANLIRRINGFSMYPTGTPGPPASELRPGLELAPR